MGVEVGPVAPIGKVGAQLFAGREPARPHIVVVNRPIEHHRCPSAVARGANVRGRERGLLLGASVRARLLLRRLNSPKAVCKVGLELWRRAPP